MEKLGISSRIRIQLSDQAVMMKCDGSKAGANSSLRRLLRETSSRMSAPQPIWLWSGA